MASTGPNAQLSIGESSTSVGIGAGSRAGMARVLFGWCFTYRRGCRQSPYASKAAGELLEQMPRAINNAVASPMPEGGCCNFFL